jgi:uncharacterized protein (UPF0333 family)
MTTLSFLRLSKLSFSRKAQISIEYIIILVIGFVLLLGGLYMFMSQAQTVSFAAESQKGLASGQFLVDTVNEIALLSKFTKTTITVSLPDSIVSIRALNYSTANLSTDLVLTMSSLSGTSNLLFVSTYPFVLGNCTHSFTNTSSVVLTGGQTQFLIESCGAYVAVWPRN